MIGWIRRAATPASVMPALDMPEGQPWGPASQRVTARHLRGLDLTCIATVQDLREAGEAFCPGCGRHRQAHGTRMEASRAN